MSSNSSRLLKLQVYQYLNMFNEGQRSHRLTLFNQDCQAENRPEERAKFAHCRLVNSFGWQ